MKYDAFISYRHTALDLSVAKKLHKALETYHIPKSVQKKTGKKRINRVFRDQEELPIGSDLNDNISEALKEAEYLIVICSPDTPGSYWVSKEINTFIELHDREHVLAFLVAGEPWESFPAQLLTDSKGNAVEPLAADIRGANSKERDKKFKTEFLRLAAPLIGCTYDDLKQRHKERIIKRNIAIGAIVAGTIALFAILFGTYNAVTAAKMKKLAEEKAALADETQRLAGEIYSEYQGKQQNQSKFYASLSESLLNQGLREDACLVAMEGLPGEEESRPFVSRAEYALSRALYTYGSSDYYMYNRTLPHETLVEEVTLSADTTRLISIDRSGYVYVFDTSDWRLLVTIPVSISDENNIVRVFAATADKNYVYIVSEIGLNRYDYDGNPAGSFVPGKSAIGGTLNPAANEAVLIYRNKMIRIGLDSLKETASVESEKNLGSLISFSEASGNYCIENSENFGDATSVSIWNTEDNSLMNIPLSQDCVIKMTAAQSGNTAIVTTDYAKLSSSRIDYDIYLISPEGDTLWHKNLVLENNYAAYRTILKARNYTENGTTHEEIVLSTCQNVVTIDETTGEEYSRIPLKEGCCALLLSRTSPYGYIIYSGGTLEWTNIYDGSVNTDLNIETGYGIDNAWSLDSNLLLLPSHGVNIMVLSQNDFSTGEKLADLPEEKGYDKEAASPDFSCFILAGLTAELDSEYLFYDYDGNLLYQLVTGESAKGSYFTGEECRLVTSKGVWYINPYAQTSEFESFPSFGCNTTDFSRCYSKNGSDYAVVYSLLSWAVINMKEKKLVYEDKNMMNVNNAIVSFDGENLYYTSPGDILNIMNLKTGEVTPCPVSEMISFPASHGGNDMAISNNEQYLALHCVDSMVRIIDLKTNTLYAEIPFLANTTSFIAFTEEDQSLLLQPDSYEISVWNMESKSLSDYVDCRHPVSYILEDTERNHTLIVTTIEMLLINNEDNGLLCDVNGAISYSPKTNQFILLNRGFLSTMPYKNYEELKKEARELFPDASLSDEKKARYNID